jgi:undecaprenyl-diphosphatase
LEFWNRAVFLTLNAPDHPIPGSVPVAMALANWAIFLVPLLFAALWLWGDPNSRAGILLTFCAAELALGLNQVAAIIWYHPRPFAVPIGRTLVEHVADSSFPSDHVTFLIASGIGLMIWTRHRGVGFAILALSIPVALARIFLGVHFPIDMVGAIPVAAFGLLIVAPLRAWFFQTLLPRWVGPIYGLAFSLPIRRHWVQP